MKKSFFITGLFLFALSGFAQSTDFYEKARRYYLDARNDSALIFLDKAVSRFSDTTGYENIVKTYHLRSRVLGNLTFFERAMDDAIKSLDISKKQQIEKLVPISLLSIGKVYYLMYNDSVAEEYMLQARSLALENRLEKEQMMIDSELAQLYSVMERNDECLALGTEALGMARQQKDTLHIMQNLNLFASYYINLNRWTDPIIKEYQIQAKQYLDEALKLALQQDVPLFVNAVYSHFVRYYRVEKDYPKALESANKVIALCEPSNYSLLIQMYDHLVGIYAHLGNEKMVIDSHQKFYRLMQRQSDFNLHQSLQEMHAKYETAEKELEISSQALVISRQKAQQRFLIMILALSAVILVLLWYFLRLRSRHVRELAELNATKDKFFSIISHDLKNPAIAQRNALQALLEHSGKLDMESLESYYTELLKSADSQVELLYNLLNWAQVQTGRMPFHPVQFDLVAALKPDLVLAKNMTEQKGIQFEMILPDTALVTGDKNMLCTVIRNLLTNAVKFTGKGGSVQLLIEKEDGRYSVSISDNGTGMH